MKICQYCGTQFEPIYKNQVYCCYEHSHLGKLKRQKELNELRKNKDAKLIGICLYCGKKFIISTARKYCSKECVRLYRNKTRRKPSKTQSKPSEDIKTINYTRSNKEIKINGILIKIENNNNNIYSWKAIRNNQIILQSVEQFTTYNDCLKDAKSAF